LTSYQEIYQGLFLQIFELETQTTAGEAIETETGETAIEGSPVEQLLALIEAEIIKISENIDALGFQRNTKYDLLNTRLSSYKTSISIF